VGGLSEGSLLLLKVGKRRKHMYPWESDGRSRTTEHSCQSEKRRSVTPEGIGAAVFLWEVLLDT
jgi:hypothetical protein